MLVAKTLWLWIALWFFLKPGSMINMTHVVGNPRRQSYVLNSFLWLKIILQTWNIDQTIHLTLIQLPKAHKSSQNLQLLSTEIHNNSHKKLNKNKISLCLVCLKWVKVKKQTTEQREVSTFFHYVSWAVEQLFNNFTWGVISTSKIFRLIYGNKHWWNTRCFELRVVLHPCQYGSMYNLERTKPISSISKQC